MKNIKDLKILCAGKEQSSYEEWEVKPVFDLNEKNIDGIVYTIPNYQMADAPLLSSLLEKQVPVFILKMRVENINDVENIAALKHSNLYIGDQYRLQTGARAVSEALKKEMCGRIEYISWRTVLTLNERALWMDNYEHLSLMDLCYHYFMTLYGYIGSFSGNVYAHSYAPSWLSDEGYFNMLLRTTSNIIIDMSVNWGAAEYKTTSYFGDCIIEGKNGRLWTDGERAEFTGRSSATQTLSIDKKRSGWAGCVDDFCENLCGGTLNKLISFEQYRDIFNLQYAALLSSKQNKSIEF
jgi:predicted dehydrogenase